MKKRLFLSVLAASLTLFSCGKKKEEEPTPEPTPGPVDPLTPEQRESATATNDLIYDYVKDSYDEETAESSKAYVLARSEHAALKGVDGKKVVEYLEKAEDEVDPDNPMTILPFVVEVRSEGLLDDFAYFGAALGQSYLKIETDRAGEDNKAYFEVALAEVEKETDNIAENAYAIVDNVLGIVDSVANGMTDHPEIMRFVMSIMSNQVIDGDVLKAVLHDLRVMLIEELAKTEENVKYFASEAVTLGAGLLAVAPNVPAELIDFVKELSFDGIIGGIYNGAKAFGEAIDNLPETYYAHFEEITIPVESYAYAVLGAVDALVGDVELPSEEELNTLPATVIGGLTAMYETAKDLIPEDAQQVIETALKDEQLQKLLEGVVKCTKDASKAELPEISVEEIAHIVGLLSSIEEIQESTGYDGLTLEALKDSEIIPANVYALMEEDVNEMEALIEGHAEEGAVIEERAFEIGNVIPDNKGSYSYKVINVHYVLEYAPQDEERVFNANVEIEETTLTYPSLQEIAVVLDRVLTKLVDKNATDAFIDDVLAVFIPAVKLFSTYVYPYISDALAKNEQLSMIVGVVMVVGGMLDSMPTIVDGLKSVINDAFIVVKDVLAAFIPQGENQAAIDFSKFLVALTSVDTEIALQMIYNSVPEDCFKNLKKLGEDLYNTPAIGSMAANSILNSLKDILEVLSIEVPEQLDGEKFGQIIYDVAVALFCPVRN